MHIGIIGLGRMGNGVARRLLAGGHTVVAYNRSQDKVAALATEGALPSESLAKLVEQLPAPRTVWLYLPSGEVTDSHIEELTGLLSPGDTVLDGGNSQFTDTLQRAAALQARQLNFMDVGTSGGIKGEHDGYCLMIGGSQSEYERLVPVWQSVAQAGGFARAGEVGAGHYVKMVHNAIEYGIMQAYAEGVELIQNRQSEMQIPVAEVAELWQHGSIISSFLGGLLVDALKAEPSLDAQAGPVADSGEGRWAIEEALIQSVPVPVMTAALFARYTTRASGVQAKVLNALRKGFGGHQIAKP